MLPKLYIDSNVIIDIIELADIISHILFDHEQNCRFNIFTSELTLLEILIRPIRDEDQRLIKIYDDLLLNGKFLNLVPIDRDILRSSAHICAELRNKGPDSIHVATAFQSGCTLFMSSDQRIKVPRTMRKISPDQAASIDL